jgi:DNA-binding PadR family transcriptional regulator
MLEYIILGFLVSKDMSGYDLKQRMERTISNFFDASFGSIYPALKRLEERTLIASREIVENGKYKKIYSIQEEGRDFFMGWLTAPVEFAKTKHDHLVRIFFYDLLTKENAEANLRDLVRQVEPLLRELEEYKALFVSMPVYMEQYFFQCSTIDYGINYYRFIIGWCNDYIKRLEEK